jgi:hypothetical protein
VAIDSPSWHSSIAQRLLVQQEQQVATLKAITVICEAYGVLTACGRSFEAAGFAHEL